MENSIHEFKVEFVYLCVGENSFVITVIILRYIRNVNPIFRKDFKIAELLTKTSFSLYFVTLLKMAKGTNKGDVKSIRPKVTKHKKGWRKLNLI